MASFQHKSNVWESKSTRLYQFSQLNKKLKSKFIQSDQITSINPHWLYIFPLASFLPYRSKGTKGYIKRKQSVIWDTFHIQRPGTINCPRFKAEDEGSILLDISVLICADRITYPIPFLPRHQHRQIMGGIRPWSNCKIINHHQPEICLVSDDTVDEGKMWTPHALRCPLRAGEKWPYPSPGLFFICSSLGLQRFGYRWGPDQIK